MIDGTRFFIVEKLLNAINIPKKLQVKASFILKSPGYVANVSKGLYSE
jgi:hypothetical protein